MTRYGLIGAGPVSQYLAARLPRLGQDLGPVSAANIRLASRIVNTLGAGEPRPLKELHDTQVLLVCAPGHHVHSLLPAMRRSGANWSGKTLVLCNCKVFSRELDFFKDQGASIASLRHAVGLTGRFIVEGDRPGLVVARFLVQQLHGHPIEIRAAHADLLCAAMTASSSLVTPLLEVSMSALRNSGLAGSTAAQVLEASFLHSLRTYLYSGRKSWSGTVAESDTQRMEREAAALRALQPEMAELYRETAEAASRLFSAPAPRGLKKADLESSE